ncbi:MAG: hypothetical protein IJF17_05920 [Thermoguttaceae bacterium]|nr:hypothetical protein [Thermoguttaceae bacterium]
MCHSPCWDWGHGILTFRSSKPVRASGFMIYPFQSVTYPESTGFGLMIRVPGLPLH